MKSTEFASSKPGQPSTSDRLAQKQCISESKAAQNSEIPKPALDQFEGLFPEFNRRLSPKNNLGLSPAQPLGLGVASYPGLISNQNPGLTSRPEQELVIPEKLEEKTESAEVFSGQAFGVEPRQLVENTTLIGLKVSMPVKPAESMFLNRLSANLEKAAEKKGQKEF